MASTEECVFLEDTSDDERAHEESDDTTEAWSNESHGSVNVNVNTSPQQRI